MIDLEPHYQRFPLTWWVWITIHFLEGLAWFIKKYKQFNPSYIAGNIAALRLILRVKNS